MPSGKTVRGTAEIHQLHMYHSRRTFARSRDDHLANISDLCLAIRDECLSTARRMHPPLWPIWCLATTAGASWGSHCRGGRVAVPLFSRSAFFSLVVVLVSFFHGMIPIFIDFREDCHLGLPFPLAWKRLHARRLYDTSTVYAAL